MESSVPTYDTVLKIHTYSYTDLSEARQELSMVGASVHPDYITTSCALLASLVFYFKCGFGTTTGVRCPWQKLWPPQRHAATSFVNEHFLRAVDGVVGQSPLKVMRTKLPHW